MTAKVMRNWLSQVGAKTLFIEPGISRASTPSRRIFIKGEGAGIESLPQKAVRPPSCLIVPS